MKSFQASDSGQQTLSHKQRQLLQQQLQRCYDYVPHYRRVFEQIKFDHSNRYQLSELQRLPTLSKEQIRQNYRDFISVKYNMERCKHSYSSGSTGEPFATYFDDLSWYRKKFLLKLRARFACGMSLGDRVAILECVTEEKARQSNTLSWIRDPALKIRVFSLFGDSDQLLAQLREFQPNNIYGYPSHLMTLGTAIANGQQPIARLERIFTASEYLKPGARQFIEQQFGVPIFDHYGSTEFKEIAWQCPAGSANSGYHINNNDVICEIVDSDGNPAPLGASGEIVITDLRNKAMPLLRYRMNDHGRMSWEECACGYSGPGLRPLGGRSSDYIILPSLEQVSPYLITTNIEHIDGLIQYQVDQHSATAVVARTVWESPPGAAQLASVQQIIAGVLGDSMRVEVEVCAAISVEENGKLKVVKRSVELKQA
jgi:phenylacetate-CoA ligase